MRTCSRLVLAAMLACLPATLLAQDTVYRWVDERGVTQYTQTPPPAGRTYDTVRMGSTGQQRTQPVDLDATSTSEGREGGTDTVATAADAERQEYCDAARRNLLALQSEAPVHLESEDGGEPTPLDDAGRANQISIAERQVALFCRD